MSSILRGMTAAARDEAGRKRAEEIAAQIRTNPDSVELGDVRETHVLRHLVMAHGKDIRDFVCALFKDMDDPVGQWKWLSENDRWAGLHSNIPECCVEYYIKSHEDISQEYPYLGPKAVADIAGSIRYYAHRQMSALPEDLKPGYHTCPECTEGILSGILRPNKQHYCKDPAEHPMCARWLNPEYRGNRKPSAIKKRSI